MSTPAQWMRQFSCGGKRRLGVGSPYNLYVKWRLPKTFIWHAVGSILGGQIQTGRLFSPCSDEPAAFPISESFFSPNPPEKMSVAVC